MGLLPVHERLAEIWQTKKKRDLTESEEIEMGMCLDVNLSFCRKYAELCNWSLMASMIDDMPWLQDVCMEIDKLEIKYKTKKPEALFKETTD